MDWDEVNAISRLVLIVALVLAAWLLAIRAYDIYRGEEPTLSRDLRFVVASGWAIAAIGLASQRIWWWMSWAVQVQGGNPAIFREYAHWAILPDIVTVIGLTLAVAPYASRVMPHTWPVLACTTPPVVIVLSTMVVLWIAM